MASPWWRIWRSSASWTGAGRSPMSVWVTDADIALLAEIQAVVVHNPHSNTKLGVGVAPVADMMAAGVPISARDRRGQHQRHAVAA